MMRTFPKLTPQEQEECRQMIAACQGPNIPLAVPTYAIYLARKCKPGFTPLHREQQRVMAQMYREFLWRIGRLR